MPDMDETEVELYGHIKAWSVEEAARMASLMCPYPSVYTITVRSAQYGFTNPRKEQTYIFEFIKTDGLTLTTVKPKPKPVVKKKR